MFPPAIEQAIQSSAVPERARQGFQQLAEEAAAAPFASTAPDHARILAAVFSGSQAMQVTLCRHPGWVQQVLSPGVIAHPRQEQGLRRDVNAWLIPALEAGDYADALTQLRLFKQREMLRVAARDLAGLADTPQVVREISNIADVCLDSVLQIVRRQIEGRLGRAWHRDADGRWEPTQFCVLGLGKLGGQELNYSSDVDVLFVYSDEGHVFKTPPGRNAKTSTAMASHQFFKRIAESFVAEVSRATSEGALFRIDLRLRPEGDAGPLIRSLPSYESFYAQWGQTWERMMLIKTRCVAGDSGLGHEFLEMIQPFRYPRSLNETALREIAAMKTRIENEVIRNGETDRDVKRGRGGIREIEFIAQTAQILNAGRIPFLQGAQTLPVLAKMVQYQLLAENEAKRLTEAYCFLRDVEHRLQMDNDLQTHTIPADSKSRAWLAAVMGYKTPSEFEAALKNHTQFVRATYEKLVQADSPDPQTPFPKHFKGAETEWMDFLAAHSFRDPDRARQLLEEFVGGPAFAHTSQRTTELAWQLVPKLFALCRKSEAPPSKPNTRTRRATPDRLTQEAPLFDPRSKDLSDPDRVLARLDSFISAYGARAMLLDAWTNNAQVFELLLLLFDRSEFLAEIAIRTPDLIDDLVLSGRLGRSKSAGEILKELRLGREDKDQRLWLRRYHQAEFMRIGLRDILGLADYEQNFIELTALAEACLQYALEIVLRRNRLQVSPLAIVGLGKLGGRELNYGSDLDIVFLAGEKVKKALPRLQRIAVEVMDMLSSQTGLGVAFVTDARLRPDGEKGLLVNTLDAYAEYYWNRAQLWEIQALTRTRPVAGDLSLGERFQNLTARLTDFRPWIGGARIEGAAKSPAPSSGEAGGTSSRRRSGQRQEGLAPPSCFTPGWKKEIARMRMRIEKERTPAGQDALAFKTGAGGLIDVEFIAQALCLEHGWHEPNTLRALERIRDQTVLPAHDARKLIDNYRSLRRIESILRRWSFEGEVVLPDDPAAYYRVSVRCGFKSPEAFREAIVSYRRTIRNVYEAVFARGGAQ